MSRTLAIVLTVVTALVCGLAGVATVIIGGLAVLGARVQAQSDQVSQALDPSYTSQPVPASAGSEYYAILCFGVLLLLIPVIVGVISFRASKPSAPASQSAFDQPSSPPS